MRKLSLFIVIATVALFSLIIFQIRSRSALTARMMPLPNLQTSQNAPTGYDPLNEQEQQFVLSQILQAENSAASNASAVDTLEVLMVERHEVSKAERATGNWPRQGDVYLYDYASDTLIRSTVDVQSGAVVASERVQGVQLPLTQREEDRALSLIRADTALWSTLTEHYYILSGEMLTDLSQLQVKVSLFRADSMPDQVSTAAKNCGQHRCAQVLIFTVDKTLLEMTPIVDLSQGKVVQVLE